MDLQSIERVGKRSLAQLELLFAKHVCINVLGQTVQFLTQQSMHALVLRRSDHASYAVTAKNFLQIVL